MIPNELQKKFLKKIKSCFKFAFLTKKFKERNESDIPNIFAKCID